METQSAALCGAWPGEARHRPARQGKARGALIGNGERTKFSKQPTTFMKLETLKFTIIGQTPLLTHSPAGMTRGTKMKSDKDRIPTPEVEAERGLYRRPDGGFGIPMIGFRSAILKAATGKKVGRKSAASVIAPAIFADDSVLSLLDPETGKPLESFELDTRRAVVQRQGIIRTRPKFSKWRVDLDLVVDTDIVPESIISECLVEAGQIVGVGDYRPECKGWFGRFTVADGKEVA